MLEFSEPQGPIFHRDKPTNVSFGDQPHLKDPLDKKYVTLKESKAFAKVDIPRGTVYSLYNGLVLSTLSKDEDFFTSIAHCGSVIKVPTDENQYEATLGHTVSQSLKPNSMVTSLDTPRFGLIKALFSLKNIKQGEELSVKLNNNLLPNGTT